MIIFPLQKLWSTEPYEGALDQSRKLNEQKKQICYITDWSIHCFLISRNEHSASLAYWSFLHFLFTSCNNHIYKTILIPVQVFRSISRHKTSICYLSRMPILQLIHPRRSLHWMNLFLHILRPSRPRHLYVISVLKNLAWKYPKMAFLQPL